MRHPGGERYLIELQALGDDTPAAIRLRSALKCLLRSFRLRSLTAVVTLIHYFTIGVLFVVCWQVLDHAAFGRPMSDIWPMPGLLPVLALAFALLALAQMPRRTMQASSTGVLIAKEQHKSPAQLLWILPGVAVGLWIASSVPGPGRVIGIGLIAIMAWVGIAVLDGFKYIVRSDDASRICTLSVARKRLI